MNEREIIRMVHRQLGRIDGELADRPVTVRECDGCGLRFSKTAVYAGHQSARARLGYCTPTDGPAVLNPDEYRYVPQDEPHECDRGARLNGWTICFRCHVDTVLYLHQQDVLARISERRAA